MRSILSGEICTSAAAAVRPCLVTLLCTLLCAFFSCIFLCCGWRIQLRCFQMTSISSNDPYRPNGPYIRPAFRGSNPFRGQAVFKVRRYEALKGHVLRAVDGAGATCSRALVSVFTLVAGLRVERPLIRSATDFRARILLVLRLQVLLIARRGSRPGYVQCLLWREGPSSTRSLAPVCPLHLALRAEDDEHVCHSQRSRREVKSPLSSFAGSPWCVLRAAKASWTHDLEVHSTEPSSWPARTAVLEKGCRKGIDQTGRQCS